jgi:4-carboxymuconolactone decarboxylase
VKETGPQTRLRKKPAPPNDYEKRTRGSALRRKVLGGHFDKDYRDSELVAPMMDLASRVCWGEIWHRPGLTHKERCLINIGILVTLRLPNEMKAFIRGGVRSGLTFKQIQETLLQTAVYCGFPTAVNAFRYAREVFDEPEIRNLLTAQKKRRQSRKR